MQQRKGVVGEVIFLMTEKLLKKLAMVGLDRILKTEIVPDPQPAPKPAETETPADEREGS